MEENTGNKFLVTDLIAPVCMAKYIAKKCVNIKIEKFEHELAKNSNKLP